MAPPLKDTPPASEALSELNGKYYMFTYEADAEGKAVWELYPCA